MTSKMPRRCLTKVEMQFYQEVTWKVKMGESSVMFEPHNRPINSFKNCFTLIMRMCVGGEYIHVCTGVLRGQEQLE